MCPEESLAEANHEIIARLHAVRDTAPHSIEGGVAALSEAYNQLYAWEVIVSQAELDSLEANHSRPTPKRELSSYEATIPPEDELRVERSDPTSPATVKIRGAPRPLKRLEWYLANRHVD